MNKLGLDSKAGLDFREKADSLASKVNSLTEKFELSDELLVSGDELQSFVKEKTKDVLLYTESQNSELDSDPEIKLIPTEIVSLDNMISDFIYIRESLKETTDNGRRVLNSLTLDLITVDEESDRAALITSFAELNRAIAENMKLYMQSYKDISQVVMNMDKVMQSNKPKAVQNNLTINNSEPISTADLLRDMSKLGEK